MKQILSNSFQTRFSGAQRSIYEIGHRNKPKLVLEIISDINSGELQKVESTARCLGAFTTVLVALKNKGRIKNGIGVTLLVETMNEDSAVAKETWDAGIKTRE